MRPGHGPQGCWQEHFHRTRAHVTAPWSQCRASSKAHKGVVGGIKEPFSDKTAWRCVQMPAHLLRRCVINILYVSAPPSIKTLAALPISQCYTMQRKHICCLVSLEINISVVQTLAKTLSPLTNKHSPRSSSGKAATAHRCASTFPSSFPLHGALSSCDIQRPNTIRWGLVQNLSCIARKTEPLHVFKGLCKH